MGPCPPSAATHVSIITEVELRFGVAAAPGDSRRIAQLAHLVATWRPIPVDPPPVATAFTTVVSAVLAAGQQPRMNDLLIAATALAHGWTLVTNDHDLARAVAAVVPVQPLT